MKRFYQSIIEEHIRDVDQMAFMSGPRQTGKNILKPAGLTNNNII